MLKLKAYSKKEKRTEFEQAEEHLNRSIDILQKQNEEKLILVVRHNLGLLYAMQNLSPLAICHLSEFTEKIQIIIKHCSYKHVNIISYKKQILHKN
ncbi:Protein of unknown function [Bacillus cytotoxicus]|uniref:Histidine kinase n=1 Tax=Bacillus cytotoxicus TaxID=580165 RepID=A0AAX2CD95_9BACI|nr:Protein of unknown function [Bacillus cytotoxicus]